MFPIKLKLSALVKISAVLACLTACVTFAQSEEEELTDEISDSDLEPPADDIDAVPEAPTTPQADDSLAKLPPIEARTYPVSTASRSQSMRVYLFDDSRTIKPRIGKIILMRDSQGKNTMAFRVVKHYYDRKQFAAVRVRKYESIHFLEPGSNYTSIEKVADLVPLPDSEGDAATAKDLDEFGEDGAEPKDESFALEGGGGGEFGSDKESEDFLDEEADGLTTLEPNEVEEFDVESFEDDLSYSDIVIEESPDFDDDIGWLSLSLAYIPTDNLPATVSATTTEPPTWVLAVGGRFGLSFASQVFFSGSGVQDSIALEASVFAYRVVQYLKANDPNAYMFVPVMGTLRYALFFGPDFAIGPYGGIEYIFVPLPNPTERDKADTTINSRIEKVFGKPRLAVGGTILVRFGPQWFLRVDGGMDGAGAGVILRF